MYSGGHSQANYNFSRISAQNTYIKGNGHVVWMARMFSVNARRRSVNHPQYFEICQTCNTLQLKILRRYIPCCSLHLAIIRSRRVERSDRQPHNQMIILSLLGVNVNLDFHAEIGSFFTRSMMSSQPGLQVASQSQLRTGSTNSRS